MNNSASFFKNISRLGLMIAFLCSFAGTAQASHNFGAEIYWDYIGPNQYRVSLLLYRDCNGINMGTTASLSVNRCGSTSTLNMNLVSGYPQDITPLCATQASRCVWGAGAYTMGIQAWLYQAVITFPAAPVCTNIVFTNSLCCRNSAITTLNNAGGQSITISGTLNNAVSGRGNSPRFLSNPLLLICANEPYVYSYAATDPDGDSLRYSLMDCRNSTTANVTYSAGFSGINPLTTANGVNINPATGAISFTPTAVQVGAICVKVEEYRNGLKIGEIVRDVHIVVQNCTNNSPIAQGINLQTGLPQANDSFDICGYGHSYCFDVIGYDPNPTDSVFMSWDNSIPGATFTVQRISADSVRGRFCWTPNASNVGPHAVRVTVKDKACPLIGQNIFTFNLNVRNAPPLTVQTDTSICAGNPVTLNALFNAPTAPLTVDSIVWSPTLAYGQSATFYPAQSAIYRAKVYYSDGCVSEDPAGVNVLSSPNGSILSSGQQICSGNYLQLNGTSILNNTQFQWFDAGGQVLGSNLSLGFQLPNLPDTTLCYILQSTNPNNGCSNRDTHCVQIFNPPTQTVCQNIIYVSPTGNPNGQGNAADPVSLEAACQRIQCRPTWIKMAIGVYNIDHALQLADNLTIEGGFDPLQNWRKTSQQGATTIHRSSLNPIGIQGAYQLIAIDANHISNFALQDLTITTAAATQGGTSTYGLRLAAASDYRVTRCHIQSGNAGNAVNGVNGVNGSTGCLWWWDGFPGSDGGTGSAGNNAIAGGGSGGDGGGCSGLGMGGVGGSAGTNPPNTPSAGEGGDSATVGSSSGGGGGGGGSGNVHLSFAMAAQPGGGAGSGGVPPGVGGLPAGAVTTSPCAGGDGGGGAAGLAGNANGANGTNGIHGANGANAPAGANAIICEYFVPQAGLSGQNGIGGTGGCGGGGARANAPNNGGGGGGGGGGGSGGDAGTGGGGGGGSFAIYIHDNGSNGAIKDCYLLSGTAGAAGTGGLGGVGGIGGFGGVGGFSGGGVSRGGNGGTGGNGGRGGNGGSGSAGLSRAIMFSACGTHQALLFADSSFNLSAQPVIFAIGGNCTTQPVTYTSAALPIQNGIANWDFSLNNNFAVPAMSFDNPGNTSYDSIGTYSVLQGGQRYSNFYFVAQTTAAKPEISCTAGTGDTIVICLGDSLAFSTNSPADSFVWNFQGQLPNPGSLTNIPSSQFNNAGFYHISLQAYSDCCGATTIDTLCLLVLPRPNASAAVTAQTICMGETATLTLNALSPTDSVLWSPMNFLTRIGQGTVAVRPIDTTIYTATVYSTMQLGNTSFMACPLAQDFEVNVRSGISLNMSASPVLCSGDGSATVSVSGALGLCDFTWSNGMSFSNATSATVTGLSVGTYCVTATDISNGCQNTACINVTVQASSLSLLIDSTKHLSCHQSNDGLIALSAQNANGPLSYNWSDIGAGPAMRNQLAAGNYCITVSDSLGCQDIRCINILAPSALTVSIAVLDSMSCNDGRLNAVAGGGTAPYSYLWSNGANVALNSALSGGLYTVTLSDVNGCAAVALQSLAPQNYMTMAALQTGFINCFGDSTAILSAGSTDGDGPYSILLNGPVGRSATQAIAAPLQQIAGLPAGTYSVVVTHQTGGCVDSASLVISQPSAINNQLTITQAILCHGAQSGIISAITSGGSSPYYYQWTVGGGFSNDPTLSNLAEGTYQVTLVDNNACRKVDSIVLTAPLQMILTDTVLQQLGCFGANNGIATVLVQNGIAPYTYLWSNGRTTALVTGLSAGNYWVTVSDANGCTALTSIIMNSQAPMGIAFSLLSDYNGYSVSCPAASDGIIQVSGAGGMGSYTYLWSSGQTTATVSGLPAGRYYATITDVSGCRASTDIWLTAPTFNANAAVLGNAHCYPAGLGQGQAQVSGSGMNGTYSYLWSNGATTSVLNNLQPGTYQVTVTNPNACQLSRTVTIGSPIAPYNYNVVNACGIASGAINLNMGPGTYSFAWNNGTQTEDRTSLNPGTYIVRITNNSTCFLLDTITVGGFSGGNVYASVVHTCYDSSGMINQYVYGFDSPSFLWNTGATTEDVSGLPSGNYACSITDATGCTVVRNYIIGLDINCNVRISGTVYNIYNTGICTPSGAFPLANVMLRLQPLGLTVFTNSQGAYTFVVPANGNFTIELVNPTLASAQICPFGSIAVNNTSFGQQYINNNFYLSDSQLVNVSVLASSQGWIRPGLHGNFYLNICNSGSFTQSDSLLYHYDPHLSFVGFTPGYSMAGLTCWNDTLNHTLHLYYQNLQPGNCRYIFMVFRLSLSLQSGQTICNQAVIYPLDNDYYPGNNNSQNCVAVTNSYDPNDKQVSPVRYGNSFDGGIIFEEDTTLNYQIRFQNLGTAPAYRVVIRDTLDRDLNPETIRNITMSHNGQLSLEDGHILVCTFDSIELPHLAFDTLGSNGFIAFSIDRFAALPMGTVIQNQASIYFDFNEAIHTNMTTVVLGLPLPVKETETLPTKLDFQLFPNPTSGLLQLRLPAAAEQKLQLFDALGSLLQTHIADGETELQLDLQNLSPGTYFLNLKTETGVIAKRFVKY